MLKSVRPVRDKKYIAYPLSFSYLSLHKKSKMKFTEAVTQRCSLQKVLLRSLQNSHQNTCVRVSFLIRLQDKVCNFIRKQARTGVFP